MPGGALKSASFDPTGSRVLTVSSDSTIKIWDSMSGSVTAVLRGHTGEVMSAAFSPDGQRVVSGSYDCTAKIWDLGSTPVSIDRSLEAPTEASVKVQPIPADETLSATISSRVGEFCEYSIVDLLGRSVKPATQLHINSCPFSFCIPIEDLGEGQFILCVRSSSGVLTSPFIVSRP